MVGYGLSGRRLRFGMRSIMSCKLDCLESLLDLQIRRKLEEKSILLAHVNKQGGLQREKWLQGWRLVSLELVPDSVRWHD